MENLETIESLMINYNSKISSKQYLLENRMESLYSYRKYTNIGLVITSFLILAISKKIDAAFIISTIVTLIAFSSMHVYFYKGLIKNKKILNNKMFHKDVKIEDKDMRSLLLHNDWTLEQMNKIRVCLKKKEMDYSDLMFLLEKTMNEDFYLREIESYNCELNNSKNGNITNMNDFEHSRNIMLFRKIMKQKGIKIAI